MFRRQVARQVAISGAVVLAGMGVVGLSATAEPHSPGRTVAPAGCVVPDDAALQATATETAEGYLSYQEWVANPAAQQVVGAVNRAVGNTFGHSDQVSAREQLNRGLLGSALDHHTQTVVVVVDPERIDQDALRGRLSGTVAHEQAESGGRLPGLRVDVRAGCSSADDLLAAETALTERTWHPGAVNASYRYYLDAADSTYHVSFGEKDRAVAEALRQVLGHRATVTVESASGIAATQASRFDDPAPHWGGARLDDPDGNFFCTSGFTVVEKRPDGSLGRPGSVTAGHCWGFGVFINSGTHAYGEVIKSFHDSTKDMALLVSSTSQPTSYDHFIYTDPGAPDVRNVVGRADPPQNRSVCVSGSLTLAKCSITVTSVGGGSINENGVLTTGLDIGRRPGVAIARKGDSGAPVYERAANDGAIIGGMLVGKGLEATASDTMFFHRVSQVEAGLGVVVSTG